MDECTELNKDVDNRPKIGEESPGKVWTDIVDRSYGDQRAKVILLSPECVEISYAVKLEFKATNNKVEYEAFIAGIRLALTLKAEEMKIRINSQLVANHLSGSF